MKLVALGVMLFLHAGAGMVAQPDDEWVDKRVVPKNSRLELRADRDGPPSPKLSPFDQGARNLETFTKPTVFADDPTTYLVMESEAGWLYIIATDSAQQGWVQTGDVVLVEKAIRLFSEQLRTNPKDARAFAMRGLVRQDNGELDLALGDYNQAIKFDPRCAFAYHRRGRIWKGKEQHDKAIADLSEAIKLNPQRAAAYQDRAWEWYGKGELDNALSDCNELVRLEGTFGTEGAWLRGLVWGGKREYDKSIADFSLVIDRQPENASAYANRAVSWHRKNEFEKALDDIDKAIEINPADPAMFILRGDIWWALDQADSALNDYAEAILLGRRMTRPFLAEASSLTSSRSTRKRSPNSTRPFA